jgi:CelD/BcsL family acetyltransferase involved in cellulose biosynthesis
MIAECSLYNADEMRQWDDFVRTHPEGTPFHLHTWIKTIYESYGFEPYLYAVRNGIGEITSILPLFRVHSLITGTRLVSLPFTDFCGPLCAGEEEERELLVRVLETCGRDAGHIEMRSRLLGRGVFACELFYKRHVLRLSADASAVFNGFDKKTIQYSIRKAQKSGVEIREENCQSGMDEFFRLNRMTRKKHGIPHQSRGFFANIYGNMFPDDGAFLLLARSDSRVIAGGLFFRLNGTVYYKYNASDQHYLTDKKPNHLLTWHAIEKACREHCELFDFGRTSPCNSGLIRYKEMWGAEARELPYCYYPKVKGLNCGNTIGSSLLDRLGDVWRRLPDPVTDMISLKILKHLA